MRHQSGEISRNPPPPRLPRSPVSGTPTGHSPQTLQLPELFDLIICGAKSRVRRIAAGSKSILSVLLLSLRRADGRWPSSSLQSAASWVNTGGRWTRGWSGITCRVPWNFPGSRNSGGRCRDALPGCNAPHVAMPHPASLGRQRRINFSLRAALMLMPSRRRLYLTAQPFNRTITPALDQRPRGRG